MVLVISCNNINTKTSFKQKQKEKTEMAIKQEISFSIDSFYVENEKDSLLNLTIDLKKFQTYQTFDEFSMKPIGTKKKSPFIYYQRIKDTIFVIASNNKKCVFVYTKHGNKWYNHRHIDFWRISNPVCKCRNFKLAHSYFRICGNDSVIECKSSYLNTVDAYHTIYIKTRKECNSIDLITEFKKPHTIYKDLQNWVRYKFKAFKNSTSDYYINGEKLNYTYLKLQHYKKYYKYIDETQGVKLTYHRNSLGLFGIQPGLENYDRHLSSSDEDW